MENSTTITPTLRAAGNVAQRVAALIKAVRRYRAGNNFNRIDKIWNNGMGRLDLALIDEERGVLFINCWLASRRDRERLTDAFPDFTPCYVNFGYPDYYNTSFYRACLVQWEYDQHHAAMGTLGKETIPYD